MKYSVNVCSHCRRRQLTITEDKMGIKECAECIHQGIYYSINGEYDLQVWHDIKTKQEDI